MGVSYHLTPACGELASIYGEEGWISSRKRTVLRDEELEGLEGISVRAEFELAGGGEEDRQSKQSDEVSLA